MSSDFDNEGIALLEAIRGGKPERAFYEKNLDLDRSRSGSANHKMQCNPCELLDALNRHDFARADAVLSWCEWYVEQALHENECLTPNPSYRGAIETGTLALAGGALERGRAELGGRLLKRSRAGIAWILAGVAPGDARKVVDHHLDKVGQQVLLIGNGPVEPGLVKGLPFFAQPGKRGHVREGGSGNHFGPFEDTSNSGIAILVAQAVGLGTYPADFGATFRALRKRWPNLPPFGFSEEDARIARAWISNPTDELIARKISEWINGAPMPDFPVAFIRYADDAVMAFLSRVDGSSTGCEMIESVQAGGLHYMGSADTGSRDSDNDPTDDVRSQVATETADSVSCRWADGSGRTIVVPKPTSPEAFRFVSPGHPGTVSVLSKGAPMPSPDPTPSPTPPPSGAGFKMTARPLDSGDWLIVADTAAPLEIVSIHPEPNHGEPQRWVARRKGA